MQKLIAPLFAFWCLLTPVVSFAADPAPPTAKTQYTCPMHPEVVQGKPGKCPKCGMKLVPKKKAQTS